MLLLILVHRIAFPILYKLQDSPIMYNPSAFIHLNLVSYWFSIYQISMENNHKIYHLAQRYDPNYPQHKHLKRLNRQSLPSSILEQLNSSREIEEDRPLNIFSDNQEIRDRITHFDSSKPYKYVGRNQILSYHLKLQKKKKPHNTLLKRSTQSLLSISKVSATKNDEPRLLTKEQVLEIFGKKKTKQLTSEQIPKWKKATNIQIQTIRNKTPENSQNSTLLKSSSQTNTQARPYNHKKIKEFSLTKLKSKFQHYNDVWNKQIKLRSSLHLSTGRKHRQPMKSVIAQVDSYREVVQERQKSEIRNSLQRIQASEWNNALRKDMSLKGLHWKDVDHIVHDGFVSIGKSKLKKQVQWIDQDKLGFFFKHKCDNKQNLQE